MLSHVLKHPFAWFIEPRVRNLSDFLFFQDYFSGFQHFSSIKTQIYQLGRLQFDVPRRIKLSASASKWEQAAEQRQPGNQCCSLCCSTTASSQTGYFPSSKSRQAEIGRRKSARKKQNILKLRQPCYSNCESVSLFFTYSF